MYPNVSLLIGFPALMFAVFLVSPFLASQPGVSCTCQLSKLLVMTVRCLVVVRVSAWAMYYVKKSAHESTNVFVCVFHARKGRGLHRIA